MNEAGQQVGSKSHQLFGATLQSSGPDGVVVVRVVSSYLVC